MENSASPTVARQWWIAAMLFVLSTINSVDRLVLASVAPVLQSTFHLSNTQYSYIVMAFMAGMTLGQLPLGAMVDRIGVRFGLPFILVGWSAANMLHVAARQAWQFSALRLVMGVFESANYPGGLKTIGQIFAAKSRAAALGFFNSGFLLGSVLAPPVVVFTTQRFGWKAAFLIPGFVGVLWVLPWLAVYGKGSYSSAAAKAAAQTNFPDLLRLRQTWGAIAVRATTGPLSQFYWFWLPLYFVRGRGATMAQMARLSSVAYVFGACGNLACGWFSGWLIRGGMTVARSRKLTFIAAAVVCVISTALVPVTSSLVAADILVGVSFFGVTGMSCILLAIMSDAFPDTALARVGGLTGAGEGVVNVTLTLCTGIILDRFSFSYVFAAASLMPVVSTAALLSLIRDNAFRAVAATGAGTPGSSDCAPASRH
jgi:ACS family hexuronate transporter-like MFS transporter